MPRAVRRPDANGPVALGPRAGLRGLGLDDARVVRKLSSNWNAQWLVSVGGDRLVLRRSGLWRTLPEVAYELEVHRLVARAGWRVPIAVVQPAQLGPHVWCAFEYIPGRPRHAQSDAAWREIRRQGGRRLAELHDTLETIDLDQRPNWVYRADVLGPRADGPTLEELLSDRTRISAKDSDFLAPFIETFRAWLERHGAAERPVMLNHGDLHGGNVLFEDGKLSGLIDFDFTHVDHRTAEFSWPWRGHYDEFIEGYEDVRPLDDSECALLLPTLWGWLLDAVRMRLLWETPDRRLIDHEWWGQWFARRPANARYLPG
jgi:Ser/Thr protein kinase RdoA (MazF antagonist)